MVFALCSCTKEKYPMKFGLTDKTYDEMIDLMLGTGDMIAIIGGKSGARDYMKLIFAYSGLDDFSITLVDENNMSVTIGGETSKGTYRINNNTITITADGESVSGTIAKDKSSITLLADYYGYAFTLYRL